MIVAIFIFISIVTCAYIIVFARDLIVHRQNLGDGRLGRSVAIGFIANFLDTVGIGSYAIISAAHRLFPLFKDYSLLPGTMNVGCSLAVVVESFFFINVVNVDALTLVLLCISALIGAFVGSRLIVKLSARQVQLVMGVALLITAVLMILKQLHLIDALGVNNDALGLRGWSLIIAIFCMLPISAAMNAGVGHYAPTMALVYMLGMSPIAAFPIMMTTSACMMPAIGISYIQQGKYSRKAALGIAVAGATGALIAAIFVTDLDTTVLSWVVVGVVIFAGINTLLAYKHEDAERTKPDFDPAA